MNTYFMGDNLFKGLCDESSCEKADHSSLSSLEDSASANEIKKISLPSQDVQQPRRLHSSKLPYCLSSKYNSKALQHLQ